MNRPELLKQPSGALAFAATKQRHDRFHRLDFLGQGSPEPAHQTVIRPADIADTAERTAVRLVAKVPHQAEHPAAPMVGEAGHLVDLVQPVLPLDPVGANPRVATPAHAIAAADHRAAVDAKLIQRGFEHFLVEPEPALQVGPFPRLLPQCLVQLLEVADLGVRELVQELLGATVGPGVQEQRPGRVTVAARSPDLLVVALDGRWHRGVNHGADVRLVDAHAEGGRGNDDLNRAVQEGRLHLVPLGRRHPCVVRGGRELVGQPTGELFGLLARRGVHDGRSALRFAKDFGNDRGPGAAPFLHHLDGQVLAPEAVDVALVSLQVELGGDVILDARRRGGGQRQHRRRPQARQTLAQEPVVGTEVVAPLRDAVRFVDRDQGRAATLQEFDEAGHAEPLGRDEEKVEFAVAVEPAGLPRLVARPARVDALGAQPDLAQFRRLVLHQGDQRREDEGGAAEKQARKLVAQRLAGTGRHDDQTIVASRCAAADFLLVRPEFGVAEDLPQPPIETGSRCHAVVSPSLGSPTNQQVAPENSLRSGAQPPSISLRLTTTPLQEASANGPTLPNFRRRTVPVLDQGAFVLPVQEHPP